ncbi:uncharacterized protein LOC125942751 isoform X2 [Dermacentor silvarum]|uniref:uncharacterized protein LOC125942751 isoform X2 n=1 Tax=Dermacentor silvarum TaxID=543639 RepID=UPI0021014AAA|nr:uncharacterized protein LOC125942751 isoform X2 [Dermacentor silvarum]
MADDRSVVSRGDRIRKKPRGRRPLPPKVAANQGEDKAQVPMTRINGDIRSNLSATGHAEKTPGDSRIPSSLRSHLCDHKLATKLRFLTNKLLCSKFSKTRAK